jgi:DNA-directed RNA polymerase specialized sigma24 family protein
MGAGRFVPRTAAYGGRVFFVVDPEGKLLVHACVAGDPVARRRFQAEFLPLIYRFEGGGKDEGATHDFLTFLFEADRLYRRLASFRGAAPLRAYLWSCILPDLLKQFRIMIRRQRLDTVPLDEHSHQAAGGHSEFCSNASDGPGDALSLLQRLPLDKSVLFKLLYIEDFDLEPAEIQFLAERSKRTVRDVLERVETAREAVRSRETVQRERLDEAESAGQWIRLHERRLVQIDADLASLDSRSPRAAHLQARRADLLHKLDKRRRQRTECLRASSHTVVTLPTEMLADLLGQPASSTRSQITRARQQLASLLSNEARQRGAAESQIQS